MTMKEYAHSCAEELKKLPTQKTVVKVCNKILHLQVDGRDITSSEVEIILGYIEDETAITVSLMRILTTMKRLP